MADHAFRTAGLSVTRRNDVLTLVVTGDLDLDTVERLDPTLLDEVDTAGPLIVDLGAAGFVDSSGIGLLVDLTRQAGSVHLVDPPRRARRLLDVTGIEHLFAFGPPENVHPT